jgi:DNA polymerase III delta prime subunit
MNEEDLEKLKRIVRTLKILDYTDEDIQKVLKIKKEYLRKLINNIDLI